MNKICHRRRLMYLYKNHRCMHRDVILGRQARGMTFSPAILLLSINTRADLTSREIIYDSRTFTNFIIVHFFIDNSQTK